MSHKKTNPTPTQLSANEKMVQRFIEQYIYDHGKSPTVREISAAVGLSLGGTHKVIQRLVEYGYLRKPSSRRTKHNLSVVRYLHWRRRPKRRW